MTKDDVMRQMQEFFRRRSRAQEKDPALPESDIEDTVLELADVLDELAENFTDASAMILDLTADLRNDLKEPRNAGKAVIARQHEEDDEGHNCGIESLVLYAVPGKRPELMSAEDALNQYGMDEMDFDCFEIREGLLLHYMTPAFEDQEEITVVDPVYIARVNVKNNRLHEITAQDYAAAMDYLAGHMTLIVDANGRAVHGYVFPKSDMED
jgi:hypothetical protein